MNARVFGEKVRAATEALEQAELAVAELSDVSLEDLDDNDLEELEQALLHGYAAMRVRKLLERFSRRALRNLDSTLGLVETVARRVELDDSRGEGSDAAVRGNPNRNSRPGWAHPMSERSMFRRGRGRGSCEDSWG